MARPTKKQQRIKQAKELQDNETLQAVFEDRERDIVERWKSSDSTEMRESCYYDVIALGELKDAIDAAASDD